MALKHYITLDDIDNGTFNKFKESTRQRYIDDANDELEDLAVVKVNGIDVSTIAFPVHRKLRKYAELFAVQLLAQDYIDVNNNGGTGSGEDKYESLFKRTRYLLQGIKAEITPVMFTGGKQTPSNRAITPTRIYFG